jgi:hypothetical protein
MCRLSRNLGASTSWNPQGLSRPVMELLYLLLHRVNWEKNIIHTIKSRKANWIGHILRRNCILEHVIEGKIGREQK